MTEITKTETIQVKRASVPVGSAVLVLNKEGHVVSLSEAKQAEIGVSCPADGRVFLGTADELAAKVKAEGLKSLSDLVAEERAQERRKRLNGLQK